MALQDKYEQDPEQFQGLLPVLPTLACMRKYVRKIKRARDEARRSALTNKRPRTPAKILFDAAEAGEQTVFQGKGIMVNMFTDIGKEVLRGVGFLMYTTCSANGGGLWPKTMGTPKTLPF